MKNILIVGFFVLATISHAEIFQCTDSSGKTIYKDKECQSDEVLKNRTDAVTTMAKMNVTPRYEDDTVRLGKNLLKNSDFEDKLVDWLVPEGVSWTDYKGANTSGGLIIQSSIPPDDGYVHEVEAKQCVALGAGSKFELKAKFKAEKVFRDKYAKSASYANRVNVVWYESLGCDTGGHFGWFVEPKNVYGWQTLSYEGLTPALHAKAAQIEIVQNASYARGYKGYWDDISFAASEVSEKKNKKIEQPNSKYTLALDKNYVKNSGFTYNISGWNGWKAKWSYYGNKLPGSAKVTFESKKGYGTGVLNQCVNIGKNTLFDLGASVKKDKKSTQAGGGRIRVSWNDQIDCKGASKIEGDSADMRDVDGWQQLEVNNLAVPAGTHSVSIQLIQSIAGAGKFSVFWDDVYFKATK